MRNAYCAGPEDDLQLPKESAQVDWEVELGVVIGKGGRYSVHLLLYVFTFHI
jgi:2-keto-4-pentenoate hydratase/2-oxohepta-3-ene-1,7-dioic acid hydratase in catechol pathway